MSTMAARFTWRATSEWVEGVRSSRLQSFYGLGPEQDCHEEFVFDADQPEPSVEGRPTAVEHALVGLAGRLTAGIAAVAETRDIPLRRVSAVLEAGMAIPGVLGVDSDVRNGFDTIRVRYTIDADASPEEIEAMVAQCEHQSALGARAA